MSNPTAPAGFPQPRSGRGPTQGSDADGDTRAMPSSLGPARDVILRDGGTLRLRPPGRADVEALVEFFSRLSPESIYQRFHGSLHVTPQLVESFVDPDWDDLGSLIGTLGDDGRIVALAEYVRLRDPVSAEVAFAVSDELQGRGIATRLLEQLAAEAAAHGIESFVAEVLAGNRPMLRVFEDAGFDVTRSLAAGEVELRFRIASTEVYRDRVDVRDHVAVAASLQPFFVPRTVAVFGASPRRGTIGGELFRNILSGEFAGAAYPINRTGTPVAGVRAYTTAEQIPDEVDLAVICVPAAHVLEAADEALQHGTRAICVISAGFTETGVEGKQRQDELLALVRAHGARLIGPNCLGIAVSGVRLNATFGPRALPPGNVAFSSQSGALGLALLEKAESRGLGFSGFVSIGNKADVSSNDLLEYWEDDDATDVILLYLESFGNPRKFGRLARRVARRKPILAMKGGRTRSGAKAAGSHTAALAGSEQAVDALFHQAGVIRAETLEELVDTAGPARLAAAAARQARRRADERRRARDPLCRRMRGRRSRAADALAVHLRGAVAEAAARGEPREPGRHARIGDRRDLRVGAAAHPERPERGRRDRAVRAACRGGGGGRGGGRRRRRRELGCRRQAGPGGVRVGRRDSTRPAERAAARRRVRLSRVGCKSPRPGR